MKNFALPVLFSVVLLTATACGGNTGPAAAPTTSASTVGEVAAAAGQGIPKPTAEQEAKLLAAVEKINPAFINRKTVDNARNQCSSILGDSPEANLVRSVKTRFEGLGVESVSDAEAKQLLKAIRTNGFCK
ncbi:hypothetical protein [Paeniglutamicibacter cryotolerans]|uniref:DUF732 domain-containing protein n=1 Tax=Paeniglutamicibacter cryotolerans TaxID=670079 RepID=A0A839QSD3_9MICC|nr:hypothetical protein [Paeniglutamicibacter cryotolerans]MBB2997684.1 hypothetical protein [Paeniglutamicibacter cryotolerans]